MCTRVAKCVRAPEHTATSIRTALSYSILPSSSSALLLAVYLEILQGLSVFPRGERNETLCLGCVCDSLCYLSSVLRKFLEPDACILWSFVLPARQPATGFGHFKDAKDRWHNELGPTHFHGNYRYAISCVASARRWVWRGAASGPREADFVVERDNAHST